MSHQRRLEIVRRVERVVVKVGTAVLCGDSGKLDDGQVERLAEQVDGLHATGVKVVVVTSGAIGAGMAALGLERRPTALPMLQAAAAIGQGKLMAAYEQVFSKRGYHAAQVLLTREDLDERQRYLNACNTLNTLLDLGAVPVVNENDTVSVEEIGFLENDALAMTVAGLVRADLLVALSSIDGLYENPDAPLEERRVVEVVEGVDEAVAALAGSERSVGGSGGMTAKLEAFRDATEVGVPVMIANGAEPNVLLRLFEGEALGTLFMPRPGRVRSRKLWLGFGARPKGSIVVDAGARRALVERGKSLLPSGILEVRGAFGRGDLAAVVTAEGEEFARGLSNYSAEEVRRIRGLKSDRIAEALGDCPYPEVIHRDNLTLLPGAEPRGDDGEGT